MILDKEKLLQDGFLSFNLKDVDLSLYNQLHTDFSNEIPTDIINHLRYDSAIDDSKLPREKISEYFSDFIQNYNLNKNSSIDYNLSDGKSNDYSNMWLKLVGKYNELAAVEIELNTKSLVDSRMQVWYYGQVLANRHPKLATTIHQIYQKLLSELYPNNEDAFNKSTSDNILVSELTLYTKDNFIESHKDAYDGSRLCAVLIYLNDEYKTGYGGEIVIENKTKIEPIFGNVVILDFTQNNVIHHVNKVIDENFKRYAFIKFFFQ